MPLVRITHAAGKPQAYRRAIADSVHAALVETLNVPADDRFQIVTEQTTDGLIYDNQFLGIHRSDEAVFIQVFLRHGRSTAMKQDFYRRVAEKLTVSPGLPANDVLIVLTENGLDDWSFGQGRAQYVENPPRPLPSTTTGAAATHDQPVSTATVAKSAGGVFAGGLVMLTLLAVLHFVSATRLNPALANAFPTDDPVAMANFTG
ncbi:MAG TPA: tautomerase family protein [Terriglobales bacterium]|nr:tautomerase family protein [Terriglobales bacterium]